MICVFISRIIFANGREMRNLFDKSKSAHANRLASLNEISDEDLFTLKKMIY